MADGPLVFKVSPSFTGNIIDLGVAGARSVFTVDQAGNVTIVGTLTPIGGLGIDLSQLNGNLVLGSSTTPGELIRSLQDNPPTVGSGGSGISALSVVAGSTNMAGQVAATLTAVAPGVVIGVVAFDDGPLPTAPIAVVCSLSAPTAGDAAPPDIGADTFTTSGFTVRSYGPTTVTTAAYVISYICIFA